MVTKKDGAPVTEQSVEQAQVDATGFGPTTEQQLDYWRRQCALDFALKGHETSGNDAVLLRASVRQGR